jgi:diadenosine tetraphosphate (Ap4A) HIT family hydrolase
MRRVDKPEALELLASYRQSLGNPPCVLCALCQHADDRHVVARNAEGTVLLNRFAQRPGHLLVVAHSHVEHAHELQWPSYAALQQLAHSACIALQRTVQPARTFTAVLGSAASIATSYPHLHIHVVPVPESDDRARPARVFSWSEGIYVYEPGEALALVLELRAAWPGAAP